jgi:hypothetical protein
VTLTLHPQVFSPIYQASQDWTIFEDGNPGTMRQRLAVNGNSYAALPHDFRLSQSTEPLALMKRPQNDCMGTLKVRPRRRNSNRSDSVVGSIRSLDLYWQLQLLSGIDPTSRTSNHTMRRRLSALHEEGDVYNPGSNRPVEVERR